MESKKGLSEVQEILIQLLKEAGLDKTWIIVILLMLKDDERGQKDLLIYLHDMKPTEEEITNKWVMGYIEAHPELNQQTKNKE